LNNFEFPLLKDDLYQVFAIILPWAGA
jgi:hypothetical protein